MKDQLISETKKPNTIKKYLTAVVKFSSFLQTNPLLTRQLRISQCNVNALKVHARTLRGGLNTSLLTSTIKTKMGHKGNIVFWRVSRTVPSRQYGYFDNDRKYYDYWFKSWRVIFKIIIWTYQIIIDTISITNTGSKFLWALHVGHWPRSTNMEIKVEHRTPLDLIKSFGCSFIQDYALSLYLD